MILLSLPQLPPLLAPLIVPLHVEVKALLLDLVHLRDLFLHILVHVPSHRHILLLQLDGYLLRALKGQVLLVVVVGVRSAIPPGGEGGAHGVSSCSLFRLGFALFEADLSDSIQTIDVHFIFKFKLHACG